MNSWVRPTVDTKFHIDSEWWAEKGRNFRVHLLSHLCSGCQGRYENYQEAELVDWIDELTGEVFQVDGLWHSLRICCSQQPDFITEMTPLTTAVFRAFLANGNEPLTAEELGDLLDRPPETILRTIGGLRVYNGIKPVTGKRSRSSAKAAAASKA